MNVSSWLSSSPFSLPCKPHHPRTSENASPSWSLSLPHQTIFHSQGPHPSIIFSAVLKMQVTMTVKMWLLRMIRFYNSDGIILLFLSRSFALRRIPSPHNRGAPWPLADPEFSCGEGHESKHFFFKAGTRGMTVLGTPFNLNLSELILGIPHFLR